MNVKQLFLLSTLCLTMGTTQASAQGFLNKLKNKGAKLVKQAMPEPVKDVVNTVEETEGAATRTRNRVESKVRNRTSGASTRRTRTQAGSSTAGGSVTLSPKKKEITIKLCRGLGPSTWYGRKNARSPLPPTCSKQDSWYRALPFIHDMDNASLVAEANMLDNFVKKHTLEVCSPVVVRSEENTHEMGGNA